MTKRQRKLMRRWRRLMDELGEPGATGRPALVLDLLAAYARLRESGATATPETERLMDELLLTHACDAVFDRLFRHPDPETAQMVAEARAAKGGARWAGGSNN